MATLSPLGLLLIFIGLSVAPLSVNNVTVQMGEYSRLTFASNIGGWWVKPDDTGVPIYYKRDGTSLVIKSLSGQEQSMDMAAFFDLTGGEDWSQPQIIRGKVAEKKTEVRTRREKSRMVAVINDDSRTGEAIITWDTSRE